MTSHDITPINVAVTQMKNLMNSGRFSEAIPVGHHLLTLYASSDHVRRSSTYDKLGICYDKLHRHDEAEKSYAIACQENRDNGFAWHNRAYNLYRWGLRLFRDKDPESAQRAHAKIHLALDYSRLAKKLNPSDPDIDQLIASIQSLMP